MTDRLGAQTAYASTGDFAIFTENGGNESISSSGTPLDITWDNTVQSNANITLQGNNSDVDLSEGGKYLAFYNAWAYEGSSGSNRRSLNSYFTLAGSELAYGRGSGYMRDSEGHTTAYINGGAIVQANAGDDLQVHIERDDGNTGAASEIQPSVNGFTILKLPDSADYLRLRRAASSSNVSTLTSFTDIQWDTADEVDTDSFGFTPTSADLTLKGASGSYFLVTANVGLFTTAGGATRQNYEMRLTLDGTEIPGTRVTTYIRGTDDTWLGQLVYTGLIPKTSGSNQILNLELRRESSGGATTVIMGQKSGVSIMAVPDTAQIVHLTDTSGTQTTSNSNQALNFNNEVRVDGSAFSHSTVSNSDRVEIDAAGNYLFFATAYTQTVSSDNNREPFRVNWSRTGGSVGRASFGSFNRSNSTFTAGASGAVLLNGLGTSDYVSMTHIDETSNAPDDSTFAANRVAVAGLLLNDNFFGLDTVVSVSGSHTTTADIPASNVYVGGQFAVQENTTTRNVTNVTISESGSIDGSNGVQNVRLYYDLDTSAPYDCTSESYSGSESQFGSTDSNGFSGADGSSSFADVVSISPTQALCLYPVVDIAAASQDGNTLQVSINNPAVDVVVTGGASVGPATSLSPSSSMTVRNAELTQIHYHWLNDDNTEGLASSVDGSEDTPALGFANGSIRRLRVQVSAEGSTSSSPTALRLEYAVKSSTCSAASGWTDIGAGGGDWDMSDSPHFTSDGLDSSDLSVANGGTTNENSVHLTPNGALKDTSSQTGSLMFSASNFLELEYAIEPSSGAPHGTTYCFRVTNSGTPLRNYTVYPEGTISADIDVTTIGTQVSTVDVGSTTVYVGGSFVISRSGTARTLTDITVTETGSIDSTNLFNPRLYFDLDTSAPYDCTGESFDIADGNVAGTAFTSANGTTTFSGGVSVSSTQTFCAYLVFDVAATSSDDETIELQISNPATDVIVTSSSVGPSSAVQLSGTTNLNGPVLTQVHYHWRNDDGTEADASSATAGVQDTAIIAVPKESARRLRLEVSNEGSVSSQATVYRLEYGTKITNCSTVNTWTDVGALDGAWDMSPSSNISDGNTTNISTAGLGAVTDENGSFVGTGALRESSSETAPITLSSSEFTELEFSIEATEFSGYGTTYCFRVTASGVPINVYSIYPELTTREKQDFYIQRDNTTLSGTSITLTAGADYIAPASSSRAFVRITNSQLTGAGDAAGTNNQNANSVTAYISDQSDITSSFTISRASTASANTRVSWEIVEFIGLEGSDNEMIVRGVGQLNLTATNFIASSSPINDVADNNDVVVFITGQQNNDTGRTNYNDGLFTASWSSLAQRGVFTRADADSSVNVSYAVVEFTGINWSVQRVEHVYTLAGSTETESITAIPAVSKGFIHAQKRVGEGLQGLNEVGHQVWLSSLGAVSFQLRGGSDTPADHASVAWVISNNQSQTGALNTYQSFGTISSGGTAGAAQSIAIGATLIPENASIFATNDSNGTGTSFPRVQNGYSIASSTHFEIWRSNTGQAMDFRVEVVKWPVADTSLRQNYFRFYANSDAVDVSDPWPAGGVDLGENTTITAADDPLGEGEVVRLRMSLRVFNATLPENTTAFKLQYGLQSTTCSAVTVWTDVGAPGSGEIWRGYDASPADGTPIATSSPAAGLLKLSVSDSAGTYEENNNSAVNPHAVAVQNDVEYDWILEHNGASQRSDYCFRMVYADDTELSSYINYPVLKTTGYSPVIGNWRWYDDEENETPTTPLATENTSPSNIANDAVIKLRLDVPELENSAGTNVKFALQYSEYADFSDGGTFLTATSACAANSIWCYADGAGTDNAEISTSLISTSDSCIATVGNGCGTHNEAASTTSSHTQPPSSHMEFEFTIRQAGARVNTMYYFRLYDVGLDQALVASSSYPNLVTEGAIVELTSTGINSGATIAGLVMDATTTATAVSFGSLPLGTTQEAAQQFTVDSNGTEGYQMLMFSDGQLVNAYNDTIPPVTASNTSPASWSSICTAGMTGCFGYHTTDATLQVTPSSRFAPDDSYAALDTNPQEIMYASIPTIDTYEVVYRIYATELQAAGDYTSNITYIITSIH